MSWQPSGTPASQEEAPAGPGVRSKLFGEPPPGALCEGMGASWDLLRGSWGALVCSGGASGVSLGGCWRIPVFFCDPEGPQQAAGGPRRARTAPQALQESPRGAPVVWGEALRVSLRPLWRPGGCPGALVFFVCLWVSWVSSQGSGHPWCALGLLEPSCDLWWDSLGPTWAPIGGFSFFGLVGYPGVALGPF